MESHPPSAPPPAATHGSFSIHDVLNLPSSIDLLDDDFDIESTMMMLEEPGSPSMMSPRSMNPYRRESSDNMELSAASLADSFTAHDTDSPAPVVPSSIGGGMRANFSPGLKIRIGGRTPSTSSEPLATSATTTDPRFKREPVANSNSTGSTSLAIIKQEPSTGAPDLSPVMDSFLRESWEDIVESGLRSARASLRSLPSVATPTMLSPTHGRVNPLPLSYFLPGSSPFIGTQGFIKNIQVLNASLPGPPSASRAISTASTASMASSASTASASSTSSSRKGPRRAKQCVVDGCIRRAQSNNRCKTHGGGARCQMAECDKSSQGGGLCRAHGGGKKCRIPGCTKGTQRLGLCYLHGGIRRCIMEGCKKKDRGNGYCISHGGGRRCEIEGCTRSVRKGNHCQMHQNCADVSPFTISRGHGLVLS